MAKVTKRTKGKVQFATQVDADLMAAFRAYAAGRGETLTLATERALRREMAYPPPPPVVPPLTPLPDAEPVTKGGRGRAKGKRARGGSRRWLWALAPAGRVGRKEPVARTNFEFGGGGSMPDDTGQDAVSRLLVAAYGLTTCLP
jgi:hypothetical protein